MYSQFSKILSLKFQFHSILHKALRSICLNGFHLGNTAFRIVWKLSQEFKVFESFAPVLIFLGFLVEKKALKDIGVDLGGGKGARVPHPHFFSCIFERKKNLTNRLKCGILHSVSGEVGGGGEGGKRALPQFPRTPHLNFLYRPLGHAFSGSRQMYFKWKVAEPHLVILKLMRHDCSFIKAWFTLAT